MAEKTEIVGVYYAETENDVKNLITTIEKSCNNIIAKYKGEFNLLFKSFHSPTVNTFRETENILNSALKSYGSENILRLEKSMIASEDFSEYLKKIPGCFFW